MKITAVNVHRVEGPGKVRAFADVTFDGCFVVKSLRIIDGRNGLFVAMPSKQRKDGQWEDLAHPITAEFRAELEDAVMAAYANAPEKEEPPF